MPSNAFTKQELVLWDSIGTAFQDQELMAKNVQVMSSVGEQAQERSGDQFWVPQPSVAISYDGIDASGKFNGQTTLSVPVTIGYEKVSPFIISAKEARDPTRKTLLAEAAAKKLASDINQAILSTVVTKGSLFIKRTSAASGFDDIAEIDCICNEQGVPSHDVMFALSSRAYAAAAGNLANRQTVDGKVKTAYERAYIGNVSNMDGFKLDYTNRIAAAAGSGITIDTRSSASNYYTPAARRIASTGEGSNVDNRYQTITVSSTTNVAAGDAFTVANCYSMHHLAKVRTDQLKTFRVVSVDSSTTMTITPPIISAQGATVAELQYQNCEFTSTASNAAITFLNTSGGAASVFWHKDSLALIPSKYNLDDAQWNTQTMSTSSGVILTFSKMTDIDTYNTKYRLDAFFGVANLNPEMNGVMLFSQA